MRPEEIDKLFKERLGNSAPTPPTDLWSRLQERMAEDQEKPVVLLTPEAAPKQESKQRFMWVYTAVAATLSLLLAVGIVFYNIKSGTPEINQTLTKYDQPLHEAAPAKEPLLITVPEKPASEAMAQQETPVENVAAAEKNLTPRATTEAKAASTSTKAPAQHRTLASAGPKAVLQQPKATLAETGPSKADAQTAIAANATPVAPAVDEAPVTTPAGLAAANLNAEPVEIIIKRAVASQTDLPEEGEQAGHSNKKALAKNIFKQVRNLANGEGVELAELGIRADRVALETQIGKQKISKVINL